MRANGHDPTYKNGFDHSESKLAFIDPITWQDKPIPERQWLVPDWIPMTTVTGIYGDGGIGKSLLAQQLLTATSINKRWIGLPTKSVKAIGVFCEDPEKELHIRQNDINDLYQCQFADLEHMRMLARFGEDNLLMTFSGGVGSPTPFFGELLDFAKNFGAELVVIDTVADTFGGNENDRGQVRQFVQNILGRMARELDGAVVALAHPSRSGMTTGTGDSGSTGWNNSFRSRAFFHSPKAKEDDDEPIDPLERVLSRKKANYAVREEAIELRWRAGTFMRKDDSGIIGTIKRRTVERVFLDQLAALQREGRHVSDNPRAGNYAPTIFASRPDREGYSSSDLRRAMETLFASQKLRMGEYKGSNRASYQEIVSC